MKHRKLLALLCLAALLPTGCSKQETSPQNESEISSTAQTQENLVLGDLSNLDCSLTESDIPFPEHLYQLKSQGEGNWNNEKMQKEFPELIAAYGGPKEEELNAGKDILIETWESGDAEFIPLEEWGGKKVWDIIYCSDTLYLQMNAIRQLNIFQPDVMEQITGEEWEDRPHIWLINEHADPIAVYEIGKDDISDISYQLDGEEVSLEEGIAFAEQTMTENENLPLISTPGFEYRAESVQVYQFEENYAYHFILNLYYQGIKLSPDLNSSPENTDATNILYIPTLDKCTMFQKNKLSGITIFDWLNAEQDSVEELKPNIDYKKALQILSGYLSDSHVFQLLNAELVYSFYVEYEGDIENGTNHITPVWQFEISAEGMQQFNRLFILIDVETGEVVELYA